MGRIETMNFQPEQLTVFDLFHLGLTKEEWLETARNTAKRLLKSKYAISIEDVLAECPRPDDIHPNATGAVFKSPEFVKFGREYSKRTGSHGREIRTWALRRTI